MADLSNGPRTDGGISSRSTRTRDDVLTVERSQKGAVLMTTSEPTAEARAAARGCFAKMPHPGSVLTNYTTGDLQTVIALALDAFRAQGVEQAKKEHVESCTRGFMETVFAPTLHAEVKRKVGLGLAEAKERIAFLEAELVQAKEERDVERNSFHETHDLLGEVQRDLARVRQELGSANAWADGLKEQLAVVGPIAAECAKAGHKTNLSPEKLREVAQEIGKRWFEVLPASERDAEILAVLQRHFGQ